MLDESKIVELIQSDEETLISLKKEYKIERKTERLISNLRDEIFRTPQVNPSFFTYSQWGDFKSRYFTPSDQANYIITINEDDGLFKDTKGKPADGRYIYIVTADWKIIARSNDEPEVHHSFLANGKKVRGAGFMVFEKGVLKSINNDSGHYQPTLPEMMPLLSFIQKRLAPFDQTAINNIKVQDFSHVSKKKIYTYHLNSLIEKRNFDSEKLRDSAESEEEYTEPKHPQTDSLKNRYEEVVKLEASVRNNFFERLDIALGKISAPESAYMPIESEDSEEEQAGLYERALS